MLLSPLICGRTDSLVQLSITLLSVRKVGGTIPGPVKLNAVANGWQLLRRFCVAEALSRGDKSDPRYTLRRNIACLYHEDLILILVFLLLLTLHFHALLTYQIVNYFRL